MIVSRRSESVRLKIAPNEWLQGQWSFCDPCPDFAVVFVHGFCSIRYGDKAKALEESCVRRGWPFATFDLRGHGESSGTIRDLRGSGILSDLSEVHKFLATKNIQKLFLVGSSMGGWASAWYAVQNPGSVIAAAYIAPGFHFLTARYEGLAEPQKEAWKRDGLLHIKNQWIEADLDYEFYLESRKFPLPHLLERYQTPTLIFQGFKDDVVPYHRTIDFVARAANLNMELILYKNGDHRLVEHRHEIAETACRFLEGQLAHSQ